MKKLSFFAAALVLAAVMSCGNRAPKADLKSDLDTLSFAMGVANTQGLSQYLQNNLGVDTAYMNEFIKGLNEGANAGDDKKKAAYYAGIQIGQQISNQMVKGINHELFGEDSTKTISLKNFMAGFVGTITGKNDKMTPEKAGMIAQELMMKIKRDNAQKQYGENITKGKAFLAANAKKQGVKTLDGGVQYRVLTEGKGAIPADTSRVKVNYEGKTIDGKVFDSSYKRGQPVDMRLNQVIPGWTIALTHMPVGSKWEIVVPQDKAYGEREMGDIKPFSTLVFTVELLEILK